MWLTATTQPPVAGIFSPSIQSRFVATSKVGLTMGLVYHDPSRTLTGEEVQASMEAVVKGLKARGAEIRGE